MTEQKWAIPEETLKVAFGKLEIDAKYYPLFVEKATKALNEIAIGYDPEQDDIDGSLEIATDFMNIYVGQLIRLFQNRKVMNRLKKNWFLLHVSLMTTQVLSRTMHTSSSINGQ